jgi:hypothetical protein
MRPFSVLVSVLAVGGLLCFTSSVSADTVILQDNFETQTLGASIIGLTPPTGLAYDGYGTAQKVCDVTTDAAAGTGHSGKFASLPNVASTRINAWSDSNAATAGQKVKLDVDLYLASNAVDGDNPNVTVYMGYYPHGAVAMNLFAKTGVINAVTDEYSGAGTNPGTMPLGAWTHLHAVADYATDTYTASLGSVNWSGSFCNHDTAPTTLDQISLNYWSANNNQAIGGYFDNLTVSIVTPEPASLNLLGIGLIGLLAYAWRKRK